MRFRRSPLLVPILALASLVSGCGDGSVQRSGDFSVLVAEQGQGDNGAGVGMGGEVTLVGNCLGIETTTVIWPYGTEVVSDDPLTIDVPGLGRVTIGDHVEGGADDYVDQLPSGIDALPSGCFDERLAVFYAEN